MNIFYEKKVKDFEFDGKKTAKSLTKKIELKSDTSRKLMNASVSHKSTILSNDSSDFYKNVFTETPENIGAAMTRSKAPRPIRAFSPLLHSKSIDSFSLYQFDNKNGKISSSNTLLCLSALTN